MKINKKKKLKRKREREKTQSVKDKVTVNATLVIIKWGPLMICARTKHGELVAPCVCVCVRDWAGQVWPSLTHPAARTFPSGEKAQHRPLGSVAMAWGARSSRLQKRTSLAEGGMGRVIDGVPTQSHWPNLKTSLEFSWTYHNLWIHNFYTEKTWTFANYCTQWCNSICVGVEMRVAAGEICRRSTAIN